MSRALAGWLQGLFWACVGAAVLLVLARLAMIGARSRMNDALLFDLSAMKQYDDAKGFLALALFALGGIGIAVFVLLIIWTVQAVEATYRFTATRSWSKGWAIGAWFIPVANWLLPWLVLSECDRLVSHRSGTSSSTSSKGLAWWILWVAFSFVNWPLYWATSGNTSDLAGILGALILIACCVCGALYVRAFTHQVNLVSGA